MFARSLRSDGSCLVCAGVLEQPAARPGSGDGAGAQAALCAPCEPLLGAFPPAELEVLDAEGIVLAITILSIPV